MLFQHNANRMIFLLTLQGCGQKKKKKRIRLASPLEVCDTWATCLRAHLMFWALPSPEEPLVAQSETQQPGLDSKPLALASLCRIKWTARKAWRGKDATKHVAYKARGEWWAMKASSFLLPQSLAEGLALMGKHSKTVCWLNDWLKESLLLGLEVIMEAL